MKVPAGAGGWCQPGAGAGRGWQVTQEPGLVPSLRSDSRCRHREQVTKALTQVPTTSTAGSWLPLPSPFSWHATMGHFSSNAELSHFLYQVTVAREAACPQAQGVMALHLGAPAAEDRLCNLARSAIFLRSFPCICCALSPGHVIEVPCFSPLPVLPCLAGSLMVSASTTSCCVGSQQ